MSSHKVHPHITSEDKKRTGLTIILCMVVLFLCGVCFGGSITVTVIYSDDSTIYEVGVIGAILSPIICLLMMAYICGNADEIWTMRNKVCRSKKKQQQRKRVVCLQKEQGGNVIRIG